MIALGSVVIYAPQLLGGLLSNYEYIRLARQLVRITEEQSAIGRVVVNQLADCSGVQPKGQSRISFEAAQELSPGLVSANKGEGIALLLSGNCNAAIVQFQNVLRLAPGDRMGSFWLGKAYYDNNQNLEALNAWKRGNGIGLKDYFFMLGWNEFLLGHSKEGIRWLEWAVNLDPQDSEARYRIGLIWLKDGSLQRAENVLKAAFSYDSNHAGIASALAQVYSRDGEWNLAYVWANRAIELQTHDVEAYLVLCSYFLNGKSLNQALLWCDEAVNRFPDSLWPWIYRGDVFYKMNGDEKALADIRHAEILAPRNIEARLWGGRILTRMERWSEAVDEYQTIIGIDPAHVGANCELAAVYWTADLPEQAYTAYETCVSLDPTNGVALQRLEALRERRAN